MSTTRDTLIHLISVLLLLLWGAVMLFFYASDRITHYLPPDGIFRPMVLWSSIGMIILGLFNLITMRSKEADCGHDHSGDGGCCGHEHEHNHGHDHKHSCCDHDHSHEHHHGHEGDHKHEHLHDDHHAHSHNCCGHDDHDHHHHKHDHAQGDHDEHEAGHVHAHGILHESGVLGRGFAIFILAVPVTYAAIMTPDSFSANAVMNKGVYNQNYGSTTRADQFSLKNKAAGTTPTEVAVTTPNDPGVQVHDQPPAGSATIPTPTPDKVPDTKAQDAKSMGNFTLADLEAQIPKSKDGNFVLEVPEIYYTAGDKEVQSVLTGQPVETIAQVLPEKGDFNPNGTRVRIFRMMVQCCAADARPYSIPVEFAGTPPAFKDMSWIKVTGKMSYEKQGDQVVPVIKAENMTEAAAPDDKMVY